jgi:hypothetical protein
MNEKQINEYRDKMIQLSNEYDPQARHDKMDRLLCDILIEMGLEEIVNIYEKTSHWYG